jgi:hypothetical protein
MPFLARLREFLAFMRAVVKAKATGGAVVVPGLSRRDVLKMLGAGTAVAALPDFGADPGPIVGVGIDPFGDVEVSWADLMADLERPMGPMTFVLHPRQVADLKASFQREGMAVNDPLRVMGVDVYTSEFIPSALTKAVAS